MDEIHKKITRVGSKIRTRKKKLLVEPSKKMEREIRSLEKERERLRKQTEFYKEQSQKKKELSRQKKNLKAQQRRLLMKVNDSIPEKERQKIQHKLERIQNKTEKISTSIFKKTDKYYYLKKNRRDLKWENNQIKDNLADPNLSKTQKMNNYKRLFKNNEEIQHLEEIIGYDNVKDVSSEGLVMQSENIQDRIGEPDELLPWEMLSEIQSQISTGLFETLTVYFPDTSSQKMSTEDTLAVISNINQLEAMILKLRDMKKGNTPKVPVFYDYEGKHISLG